MIDTITFDLWNTLIINSPPDMEKYRLTRVEKMRAVLQENGLSVDSGRLLEAYRKGLEKYGETWRRNLDLSTKEQLKTIFQFLDDGKLSAAVGSLLPDLAEAYVSPILENPPELVDGAMAVLEEMNQRGYRMGLICNTGTTPGRIIRILLRRFGMIRYFKVTTFSDELKIRKPDPRIFLHTLAELESLPQSSAHVGDLIDVDVWGARNVGMVSVHFHPDQTPCDALPPDLSIKHLEELRWILGDLNRAQKS